MKQKGFGLMELLVVVGIIAILGAIALPQYNKYVTKTRITEALHAGQVYARKVESEAAGAGGAGAEPTVDLATITRTGSGADTRVNIALDEAIDSQALIASDEADLAGGKVLVLTPTGTSEAIRWACTSNLPASKMPKVCTFDAGVGGPQPGDPWEPGKMGDATACWDQDYAVGDGGGNGWVVGEAAAVRDGVSGAIDNIHRQAEGVGRAPVFQNNEHRWFDGRCVSG